MRNLDSGQDIGIRAKDNQDQEAILIKEKKYVETKAK